MSAVQCERCGRTGGGLGHPTSFFGPCLNRWVCGNMRACNNRVSTLGQWTGTRVLKRRDRDGVEWTIRRGVYAPVRPDVDGLDFVLTMTYREHRLSSWHTSIDAAKAHADEMIAMWAARNMREFMGSR